MSVKLRLRRMGKKKKPFYRIVAIDSRASRNGRYLENLGFYDPVAEPVEVSVKEERALHWLGQGAIPSDTVKSFFRKKGIMLKWHLMKTGAEAATIEQEIENWKTGQLEREKRAEAEVEQKKRAKEKEDKTATEEAEKAAAEAKATEEAKAAEAKAAEPEAPAEAVKTEAAPEAPAAEAKVETAPEAATEETKAVAAEPEVEVKAETEEAKDATPEGGEEKEKKSE